MKESSYILALLSNQSVSKAGYVQKELKEALEWLEQMPPSKIFLIPVRIEECEPENEQLHEIQWVDLFPEENYGAGFQKILSVLLPDEICRSISIDWLERKEKAAIHLRSKPLAVSEDTKQEVFKLEYIENDFEDQGEVILDHATGLMWQKSGSDNYLPYEKAQSYIDELNQKQFGGYNDWRLPTISELMSLLEPEIRWLAGTDRYMSTNLYLNPIFDNKQRWCWSADKRPLSEVYQDSAWCVSFHHKLVIWGGMDGFSYIRGVREMKT